MMSSGQDCCRICQCEVCEIEEDSPLIAPCLCDGSMKFVHQECLQKWIKSSDKECCELCKYEYKMTSKVKPFRKVSTEREREREREREGEGERERCKYE